LRHKVTVPSSQLAVPLGWGGDGNPMVATGAKLREIQFAVKNTLVVCVLRLALFAVAHADNTRLKFIYG
jgi:hypothetical protein